MEQYNEICCDSLKSSIFPLRPEQYGINMKPVQQYATLVVLKANCGQKWFEYTDNHKIKLLGNNEGNKYHNDMGTRVAILERRH